MIILGGLIISGCANAVPQNKETASWSLEGMFVDDIENPACILGIEHKTSEDGSEKEGYYGYFIEGQTFYDVTYEENDGELSGEFISYDDEYVENGRMHANLKEESGNIRMSADSGKEYLLVPDGSEDNDSLKFFQYNSKNVLLAYDGMKTKNPYLYEQDILADYPGLIKKYLRVKEEVLSSCRKQYEKVVPKGVTKYIGVVGRGSDYNMQLTGNL